MKQGKPIEKERQLYNLDLFDHYFNIHNIHKRESKQEIFSKFSPQLPPLLISSTTLRLNNFWIRVGLVQY